ncbi:MAG: HIT domain-containing protein, partial [Actinomycetales bacterium]
MSDCLFCRIAAGEIPAEVVLRQDGIIAFRDITPQAPVHVLVIPTVHAATAA